MKIVTYNLNGIRAALNRNWLHWLIVNDFDIVCVQELKAEPGQIDITVFEQAGYNCYWHAAQKKGYSGVAIFSKRKPDHVEYGCGFEDYDKEGRVLRADYGDTSVFSIYFPSGTMGELRQSVKYQFLDFIYDYFQQLRNARQKLIICGDYNIANKDIDIHNPITNKNTTGFLPEERAWLDKFFESGFIDTFRHFNNCRTNFNKPVTLSSPVPKLASLQFNIYPNPATDKLFISFGETLTGATAEIYNSIGQLMKSIPMNDLISSQIDISDLDAGSYIVKVVSDSDSVQKTFEVIR